VGWARAAAALALAASLAATALVRPAAAVAQPTAELSAAFSPDRPGANTTVKFTLALSGSQGGPPPPLTSLGFRLPVGMDLVDSQLGLAICSVARLRAHGASACPPDSRLGMGRTRVTFTFGPGLAEAEARVEAFLGEVPGPGLSVLIYVEVISPVFAVFVFPSRLVDDAMPFGEELNMPLPLIPTLPEAPDLSITRLKVSFGPRGLVYSRRVHGHTIRFAPRGLSVPERCPRGGFPFDIAVGFLGGERTLASTLVKCPSRLPAGR